MNESDFTIKKASIYLDCTTQNLYGMQDKLKELGYWKKSDTGKNYITPEGINYLQDKRAETMQSNSKGFKTLDCKDLQSVEKPTATGENNELLKFLQEQIKELKEEKDYWKKQAEAKDQELQKKNDYIMEWNVKAFSLLGTAEDNKRQEQESKKGFFKRFFS